MKVSFRDSFAKDLKRVKDKVILKRVMDTVEAIEQVDSLNHVPDLKKLKGRVGYFRLRIGDYRVGLAFEHDSVVFVRFLNRKDIYKFFP